jgi:hypothetical protein
MSEPTKPLHHHLRDYFFPHPENNYRPHLFSRVSVTVLAVVIIACEVGYVAQTKFVFLSTDFLASVLPSVLTDLTNQARAANSLAPVTRSATLDAAAELAARDMASKGYFAHVAPDGTTPWYWLNQAGYSYSYAGQNLAVNFSDSENVQSAWLESPTHRENIMKPQYTEVGFGTATGYYQGQETTFVVEYFAKPAAVKTGVAPKPIAVATKPVATTPATTTPTVLGSEVNQPTSVATSAPQGVPTTVTTITEPATPLAPETTRFVSVLASPLTTLETILTALLTIIAIAYGIAVVVRGKAQHRSVVFGGAFLMFLIGATLLGSALVTSPVLIASNTQMASVGAAF